MTPQEKKTGARIGAYSLHAQGKTNVGPAQKGFMAKFERQVDPEGVLSPEERAKRAEAARKAHMAAIRLKSQRKKT